MLIRKSHKSVCFLLADLSWNRARHSIYNSCLWPNYSVWSKNHTFHFQGSEQTHFPHIRSAHLLFQFFWEQFPTKQQIMKVETRRGFEPRNFSTNHHVLPLDLTYFTPKKNRQGEEGSLQFTIRNLGKHLYKQQGKSCQLGPITWFSHRKIFIPTQRTWRDR